MTKKMKLSLYIQTKNACSLYSTLYILRTKYWILFNEVQREKIKNQAIKDWILSETTWAIFERIFKWVTWYIYKELWLALIITEFKINSKEFKNDLVHWNSFCIGLLKANKNYVEAKEDDLLNKSEIDKMVWTKHYWHALTYKLEYLIDSLDWWTIKLNYYDLLYWIDKEVFYQKARSFKLEDELLEYYLVQLHRWSVFERIELLDDKNKKAIEKAIKLRWYYRKKAS
jgi:hypothetical protein